VQFSDLQNTDDNSCKCAVLRVIQKTGKNKRRRKLNGQPRMDNRDTHNIGYKTQNKTNKTTTTNTDHARSVTHIVMCGKCLLGDKGKKKVYA
jgi:predicted MarR family transcription regulator